MATIPNLLGSGKAVRLIRLGLLIPTIVNLTCCQIQVNLDQTWLSDSSTLDVTWLLLLLLNFFLLFLLLLLLLLLLLVVVVV